MISGFYGPPIRRPLLLVSAWEFFGLGAIFRCPIKSRGHPTLREIQWMGLQQLAGRDYVLSIE